MCPAGEPSSSKGGSSRSSSCTAGRLSATAAAVAATTAADATSAQLAPPSGPNTLPCSKLQRPALPCRRAQAPPAAAVTAHYPQGCRTGATDIQQWNDEPSSTHKLAHHFAAAAATPAPTQAYGWCRQQRRRRYAILPAAAPAARGVTRPTGVPAATTAPAAAPAPGTAAATAVCARAARQLGGSRAWAAAIWACEPTSGQGPKRRAVLGFFRARWPQVG